MFTYLSLWLYSAFWSFCPTLAAPSVPPPCLNGIINHYTPVLGFGCDSSTLQVGTLTGFATGDKVLLLQMQVTQVDLSNTPNFGTVLNTVCIGNYEFNRIQSIAGNTVQLQFALTRSYDLSGKVQLVRVPEYDSATVCNITCLPWNGSIGGVLALDVKNQLTMTGPIDVSGRGFRGGIVEPNDIPWVFGEQQYFYAQESTLAGEKGEGIVSIPQDFSFGRGRAGNGGGGGNAHNGGGGGGANAGSGGKGGLEITNIPAPPTPNTDGLGGQKYFDNQTNKILLGGGGGAGHANDTRGTSGGTGGGIALILANSLQTNNFRILANGVNVFGGQDQNDGQGGGGGGGTVVLQIAQINGILNCELRGGHGGSNPYIPDFQVHGPGGGGGGGKLLLTQNSANVIPILQGGANGLSSQNYTNGAMPGEAGRLLTGFVLPEGTEPAHHVSNQMLLALQSPNCSGTPNGQISILQSTALAFRLNGGPWQPDSVFTNLAAGVYQIGLQFAGGCTLDTSATLTIPPPVLASLLSITNAGCAGGGSIEVTAISGTAPFEFQINSGPWQSDGLFANLLVGNYSITVRDAGGCTHTSNYSVTGTAPVLDSLLSIIPATCVAGGTLSVVGVSGTAPFEFQINGGAWQASGLFQNLPAGNYSITLRDGMGCVHSSNYTVPPPPPVRDSLVSLVDATCVTGGEIFVAANGGTAPYTFQINGGPWLTLGQFSDLPFGNYVVTVRDAAGCVDSSSYMVDNPPSPQVSLLSIVNATCVDGGAISVSGNSGTSPYEFQINGGAWQAAGIFSDLPTGNYTITLRDAGGCTDSSSYVVNDPPSPQVSLLSIVNATCVDGGAISVNGAFGTSPYEFQINGGTWQPSGIFSDLASGNYSIAIRDAAGCTDSSSYVVNDPPMPQISLLSIVNATCIDGGAISVNGASGTSPYEFQINGGAWQPAGIFSDLPSGNYSIVVRDAAGCTDSSDYVVNDPPMPQVSLLSIDNATCVDGGAISVNGGSGTSPYSFQLNGGAWQQGGIFSDLPSGNYAVTLRDAAGCTDSSSYVVNDPPLPQVSLLSIVNATCVDGGEISVSGNSGTSPYSFQINGGAWQPAGIFSDLPSGIYSLTLRDAAGCTDSSIYVVNDPPLPQVSLLSIVNATCVDGGAISVSGNSGTSPYSFQINGGAWQPLGLFSDLPAGNYVVTLRDAAGCTESRNYIVNDPPLPQVSLLSIVNATCVDGGSISVSGISGTSPYSFQIDGGAWQNTGLFQDLTTGNHVITVRDSSGCTGFNNYSVDGSPTPMDSLLSIVNTTCIAGGAIFVIAVSGTGPFEFQLDGGAWQESGLFDNLPVGDYSVVVRDSAGCTHASDYSVAAPPLPLDSLLSIVTATCVDGGSISVTGISGTTPFEFQLNGGPWQSSGVFTDLPPANYTIGLRDSAGCTHLSNYSVPAPLPVLDTLLSIANASCLLGGSISVSGVTGVEPFEFQINAGPWQPGGFFSDLSAANYSVTLRDSAGCTHTSVYTIEIEDPLVLVLDSLGIVDCRHPLGFVAVSATGGSGGYSFLLNNGLGPNSVGYFTALTANVYAVTVTDSLGCETSLDDLNVLDLTDSVRTQETVTIYEGGYYQLPDGTRTGKAGQYPFHFETVKGCDSLHIINLIVLDRHVYVPNVFLPNNEGLNNFFTVYSDESLDNVQLLEVYDRWGELVFRKENLLPNDEENGWDGSFRGRPVNPGVFVWVAKLIFKDGLELSLSGNVTVVR